MKKILFLLVFAISITSAHAQTENQLEETSALVQRIDSLEHELAYLKLHYELSSLKSELNIQANQISIKSSEISINIFHSNFNSKLGEIYKQYYEVCVDNKESIKRLIDTKIKLLATMVLTNSFSEEELNVLILMISTIESGYKALEASINSLEVSVDFYNDHL